MRILVHLSILVALGCSSSKTPVPVDAPKATVDAFSSLCGHPGDVGNELGVGLFCEKLDDCANNTKATICSSLGNDPANPSQNAFFCTLECTQTSPAGFCGTNAACMCGSAGCGCAPNTCTGA
jgi:hypothetical protein